MEKRSRNTLIIIIIIIITIIIIKKRKPHVASADPDLRAQEVRVGTRSQHQPIMFRMLDRQSAWGYHRAIRTVIPCALTFGLIGYPFVLPDMIGGNGVDEVHIDSTVYPDAELYVRWLQVRWWAAVAVATVAVP